MKVLLINGSPRVHGNTSTMLNWVKEGLEKESEFKGHIHIVTPDSVCEELIHNYYIDFHNKFPSISVKFTTADTTDMFDMLDHNEADFIITLDSHSYHKDYVIAIEEPVPMHFVANSKYFNISEV